MRLFLDASVLLSASGSVNGSSYALFSHAAKHDWALLCSPYVLSEVLRNLPKLPAGATTEWPRLLAQLTLVDDIVSLDRPVIFSASKDRPILFTALAWAEVLLTLDQADFASLLGGTFYGLRVLLPYDFLRHERAAGRLQVDAF